MLCFVVFIITFLIKNLLTLEKNTRNYICFFLLNVFMLLLALKLKKSTFLGFFFPFPF